MTFNKRQAATLLAALRFWQRSGDGNCPERDVADDGGTMLPLSAEEIDGLCESINSDEAPPAVVLDMEGGLIQSLNANTPMRVIVLDADTEGGDPDNIAVIDGVKVYLTDARLNEEGAEYVADVIRQLDAR